jgi:hypothetical protein
MPNLNLKKEDSRIKLKEILAQVLAQLESIKQLYYLKYDELRKLQLQGNILARSYGCEDAELENVNSQFALRAELDTIKLQFDTLKNQVSYLDEEIERYTYPGFPEMDDQEPTTEEFLQSDEYLFTPFSSCILDNI